VIARLFNVLWFSVAIFATVANFACMQPLLGLVTAALAVFWAVRLMHEGTP